MNVQFNFGEGKDQTYEKLQQAFGPLRDFFDTHIVQDAIVQSTSWK